MTSESVIIKEIEDYIAKWGGTYQSWYVGIAEKPRERLFQDHSVDQQNDRWVYDNADSSLNARNIEKYFIETRGTDGGTGGGDANTTWAYAYRKNNHTNP